jgi:hypothetical protein
MLDNEPMRSDATGGSPFWMLVVQTTNGAEFQSHFRWHLEEHDVRHVYPTQDAPLER